MGHGNPHSNRRAAARAAAAQSPVAGLPVIQQRLDLVDRNFTVGAAGAGVGFGTVSLGPLPRGRLLMLARVVDLTIEAMDQAEVVTAWEGDASIGTAGTTDADVGDAGEANILASTAIAAASSWVGTLAPADALFSSTILDNSDGTGEINFNLLVDAAHITDATSSTFQLNGYVELVYVNLGPGFPVA